MSDSAGLFAVVPQITITLAAVKSIDGMTIRFPPDTGDYANSITITYRDSAGETIRSDNYEPDDETFYTGQAVSGYKSIVISFHSTNKPYRYLRVVGITTTANAALLDARSIRDCQIVEQIDPSGLSLPYGTMDFSNFASGAGIDAMDPSGLIQLAGRSGGMVLRKGRPLYAYERVDSDLIYMGCFYIDTWDVISDDDVSIHAVDLLGKLDLIEQTGAYFSASDLASPATLGDLEWAVFAKDASGNPTIEAYQLPLAVQNMPLGSVTDPDVIRLYGALDRGTMRTALQQLAFGLRGYAVCARAESVIIRPTPILADMEPEVTLTASQVGLAASVKLTPAVTAIEAPQIVYAPDPIVESIFDGKDLGTGYHLVDLGLPSDSVTITANSGAATADLLGPTLARVHVTSAGNFDLSATQYVAVTQKTRWESDDNSSADNVVKISDIGLYADYNAGNTMPTALGEHLRPIHVASIKIFSPSNITVGSYISFGVYGSKTFRGVVTKMDIDLSGGFIAGAEVHGELV